MRTRILTKSFLGVFSALFVLSAALWWVPMPEGVWASYSQVVFSREGIPLRSNLSPDQKWRFPVETMALPQRLTDSLICLEDRRFKYHLGFDPFAIGRAAWQNLKSGRVRSGASTLSMQLARMLEPKERTLWSKVQEVFRAMQYEMRLGKSEILRLYLTYAPYGGNLEGVETAAWTFFQKPAADLTLDEFAFLLILPQNPRLWSTQNFERLHKNRNRALARLGECQIATHQEVELALLRPLPTRWTRHRVLAPHWSDYLMRRRSNPFRRPNTYSTINYSVQAAVEKLVQSRRQSLSERGVQNIAVLLIENQSSKIRAAIGNFDHLGRDHGQFISSLQTKRSPGSTLKPILFAYGLQNGYFLPQTLLKDVPSRFSDYEPKNFDGEYRGLVRADEALAYSLNIPFIRMLAEVGLDRFIQFLQNSDLSTALPVDRLGLSMAIGSIALTPLDIGQLYTALANYGKSRPLVELERGANPVDAIQWIHPGAALLTRQVLKRRNRPDFPLQKSAIRSLQNEIHWKTGTSQGRRDAWSVGFDDQYTVVVWMGNLNYDSSPRLTGSKAAAPMMFDVFQLLQKQDGKDQDLAAQVPPWTELEEVEICTYSGYRAQNHCPHKKEVHGVKGSVPREFCPFHQRVYVDQRSGLRVHKNCGGEVRPQAKTFLRLGSELQSWMRQSHSGLELLPRFDPRCQARAVDQSGRLKIVSPRAKNYKILTTRAETPDQINLPLNIHTSDRISDVKCVMNGKLLKINDSISVARGLHHLFCSDMTGSSDEVSFRVEVE